MDRLDARLRPPRLDPLPAHQPGRGAWSGGLLALARQARATARRRRTGTQAAMCLLYTVRQGPVALRPTLAAAPGSDGCRPGLAGQAFPMHTDLFDDGPASHSGPGAQARSEGDAGRLGQCQPDRHRAGNRGADRGGQCQPGRGHGGDRRQRSAVAQGGHRRASGEPDRPGQAPGQGSGHLCRRLGVLVATSTDRAGSGFPDHPPVAVLGGRSPRHRRGPGPCGRGSPGIRRALRAQADPDRRDRLAQRRPPTRNRLAQPGERSPVHSRLRRPGRGRGLALQPDRSLRPAMEARQ